MESGGPLLMFASPSLPVGVYIRRDRDELKGP